MNRHRSGCFKARRASVAVPLIVARVPSEPHCRAEATKRARWLALRDATTAKLRAEWADKVFVDWMEPFV